jgi:Ca2+/Na+ antiporter
VLKFDFFLFVGFIVQFLVIVPNTQQSEFWVTVAAIPIVILLLILAAVSARREYKIGTGISIVSQPLLSGHV